MYYPRILQALNYLLDVCNNKSQRYYYRRSFDVLIYDFFVKLKKEELSKFKIN